LLEIQWNVIILKLDINYSSNTKDMNFNINKVESEELLNEQDYAFMKKRYDEGTNEILEDAKRRHVMSVLPRQI
jgi:hypothetical protein